MQHVESMILVTLTSLF